MIRPPEARAGSDIASWTWNIVLQEWYDRRGRVTDGQVIRRFLLQHADALCLTRGEVHPACRSTLPEGGTVAREVKRIDADIVLAGGGPGGCEIARHFAKKGRKVVLIERGANSDSMLGWPVPLGSFVRLESRVRLGLPSEPPLLEEVRH